jgi:Ion channel
VDFLISLSMSVALVAATVLFHYEGLRFLSFGPWSMRMNPRMGMQVVILAVFLIHIVEIAVWGIAYWFGDIIVDIGSFAGDRAVAFRDYLYFSVETYTSLGYGDIYPLGELRLLAGIECLNGLLLLGWSASFTFLQMQRYWDRHAAAGPARMREKLGSSPS